MWSDSIIEEIHKIRKEHAEQFNYDLDAIVKDYQQQQRGYPLKAGQRVNSMG
jgi:hypothetical protein